MICSKCGEKLKCIDSRQIGGYRWRRYVCPECGLRGNTREYPEKYWKSLINTVLKNKKPNILG